MRPGAPSSRRTQTSLRARRACRTARGPSSIMPPTIYPSGAWRRCSQLTPWQRPLHSLTPPSSMVVLPAPARFPSFPVPRQRALCRIMQLQPQPRRPAVSWQRIAQWHCRAHVAQRRSANRRCTHLTAASSQQSLERCNPEASWIRCARWRRARSAHEHKATSGLGFGLVCGSG